MEPNFANPSGKLLNDIMSALRIRYAALNNVKYDAAWTDSHCYCRCFHGHPTLIEAAKCGLSKPGFYVVALERNLSRELTPDEDKVVDAIRFGNLADSTEEVPHYEKIVREMNIRLARLFYAGDLAGISEKFGFPMAALQAIYHKAGVTLFSSVSDQV